MCMDNRNCDQGAVEWVWPPEVLGGILFVFLGDDQLLGVHYCLVDQEAKEVRGKDTPTAGKTVVWL